MEMAFVVIVVATQKIQKNIAFDLAKIKNKKIIYQNFNKNLK